MLENINQNKNSSELGFLQQKTGECFQTLLAHSLYGKYSSSQNFYFTQDIDAILNEQICEPFILFNQYNYLYDGEEFLKREYADTQFNNKIKMLSQYYKFHRDLPVWGEKPVHNIMARYYDKVKDYDYKKIKKILKEEQNVSISTHKSFSSFSNSEQPTKKSRYPTMLRELNHTNNQSCVLMDICDKIDKALRKVKGRTFFKGNFQSTDRKFEDFIKNQSLNKQQRNQKRKKPFGLKKIKFNPKLQTKNDELQMALKQINFISNRPSKNIKLERKQVEKATTANQTIQREEKSKTKKDKISNAPATRRRSISLKKRRSSQSQGMIKTKNIVVLAGENLKTIDEIYKPTEKQLGRKDSSGTFSRLRNRSNSHHTFQVTSENREVKGKKDSQGGRFLRMNSQKVTKSTGISTTIDINKNKSTQKAPQRQRISRCNSLKKVNQAKKLHKESKEQISNSKNANCLHTRKGSMVQNMLQKKLQLFKKKPVLC